MDEKGSFTHPGASQMTTYYFIKKVSERRGV